MAAGSPSSDARAWAIMTLQSTWGGTPCGGRGGSDHHDAGVVVEGGVGGRGVRQDRVSAELHVGAVGYIHSRDHVSASDPFQHPQVHLGDVTEPDDQDLMRYLGWV